MCPFGKTNVFDEPVTGALDGCTRSGPVIFSALFLIFSAALSQNVLSRLHNRKRNMRGMKIAWER